MSEKEIRKGYEFVETVPANRINWGAILGGTAIGLFTQILFILLGIAIGVTALEPGETIGERTSIATGIYLALATLISVFVGAWATGRFSGLVLKNDGVLHGIATLSLLTLISMFALAQGVDNALTYNMKATRMEQMQARTVEETLPGERTGAAAPFGVEEGRADGYDEAAAWIAFITGLLSLPTAAIAGVMGMKSRPIKDEHRPLTV